MKSKQGLTPIGDLLLPQLEVDTPSIASNSKAETADLHQTVWAEPQLFLLPFCVPQDKAADRSRSIELTESVKIGNTIKERSFRVIPDPKYGLPGSFELLVIIAIYQLAAEQMAMIDGKMQVPEYIELGSMRSFLALLGKPPSGKYMAMLRQALKRLTATHCVSEGFFYSKPLDLFLIEGFSFLVKAEISGEVCDQSGNRYETTRVCLHQFIKNNLNANFRTLIDFDFVRGLKTDLAKSLSFHLSYRFFKQAKSSWDADYEWIANRIAVKVYDDTRMRRRQFKPALEELVNTGFLSGWKWLPNGKIRFEAGEVYISHHQKRVQAKDRWIEHQDNIPKQLQLLPIASLRNTPKPEIDALVGLCAKFSVQGWAAVEDEAKCRGINQAELIEEALKRGFNLSRICSK